LPVFAVAALVAARGFAVFILTERPAGLTVMGFLIGYPVLFVVEAVGVLLRYDDPLPRKLAIVGVLFVVAVVTGSPPSSRRATVGVRSSIFGGEFSWSATRRMAELVCRKHGWPKQPNKLLQRTACRPLLVLSSFSARGTQSAEARAARLAHVRGTGDPHARPEDG